jgi:superfamily II DNA helicase RecQ
VRKKRKKKTAAIADPADSLVALRFAALKDWRKRKAKELDIAAFMVFSDKTLRELASVNPKSQEALLAIHGIGEAKAETFGRDLLAELASLR